MLVDISGDLGWWCVVKQRIEEKIWCDLVHWLLSCRLACRCSKQYGLILPLVQLLCQICVAHVRTPRLRFFVPVMARERGRHACTHGAGPGQP